MLKPIEHIKDLHKGEDVYLLASGKSMDFYPKGFFDDVITIGVNNLPHFFPCNYTILHHIEIIPELIQVDTCIVASQNRCGISASGPENHHILEDDDRTHYLYQTAEQGFTNIDYSVFKKENYLLTAGTTIVSAIDFCRHIGAKKVFVCGVDGINIKGQTNFEGYYEKGSEAANRQLQHVENTRDLFRAVVKFIIKCGVQVIGLNPFIDMRDFA